MTRSADTPHSTAAAGNPDHHLSKGLCQAPDNGSGAGAASGRKTYICAHGLVDGPFYDQHPHSNISLEFTYPHQISFSDDGSLTIRLSRGDRPVFAPELVARAPPDMIAIDGGKISIGPSGVLGFRDKCTSFDTCIRWLGTWDFVLS